MELRKGTLWVKGGMNGEGGWREWSGGYTIDQGREELRREEKGMEGRYTLGKEEEFDNREEWKEGCIIGKGGRNGGREEKERKREYIIDKRKEELVRERERKRWEGKIYHRQRRGVLGRENGEKVINTKSTLRNVDEL